jgi:hypothetical protein
VLDSVAKWELIFVGFLSPVSLQQADAEFPAVGFLYLQPGKLRWFSVSFVPMALCATLLWGCSSRSTLRDTPELTVRTRAAYLSTRPFLVRLSEPKCEFKPTGAENVVPNNSPTTKLEYERRCYQKAELTLRRRVQALQVSVNRPAGLHNEPDCEFKPIGLGDTVDTVQDNSLTAKLEYERRCYRDAETTMRRRLQQLQISFFKRARHRHNHSQNNTWWL